MLPGARTAEGQLFITAGPPAANSPFQSGLALTPLGQIYTSTGAAPVFSPADLFMNGEQGAWYDPSDFSTMFQDAAGTIPVTAVGQPVGLILDKSGRSNDASQATAAARPLLQQDGNGKYYLEFDGVDDYIVTTAPMGLIGPAVEHFSGIRLPILQGNSYTYSGKWLWGQLNDTGRFTLLGIVDVYSNPGFWVANELDVNSILYTSGIGGSFRKNGTVNTTFGNSGIPSVADLPVEIGGRPGIGFSNVHFYSLIIRGVTSSPQEITDTETWINDKTGAY